MFRLDRNYITNNRDVVHLMEHTYQEVLRRFLKSQNGGRLKLLLDGQCIYPMYYNVYTTCNTMYIWFNALQCIYPM